VPERVPFKLELVDLEQVEQTQSAAGPASTNKNKRKRRFKAQDFRPLGSTLNLSTVALEYGSSQRVFNGNGVAVQRTNNNVVVQSSTAASKNSWNNNSNSSNSGESQLSVNFSNVRWTKEWQRALPFRRGVLQGTCPEQVAVATEGRNSTTTGPD
jgi:hypothetical protein